MDQQRSSSIQKKRKEFFRRTLLSFFRREGRDLPWRKTRDPYRILVSEVMLQQTQVSRVIEKYRNFLRRFPSARMLAKASRADVIRAWSGLGYNRRALNLQRTTQEVMTNYQGVFPRTVQELEALPGIGPYTARALAAFAYEQPVAMIDTNVRRVIGRYFVGLKNVPPVQLERLADALVRKQHAWAWGHALMDFGAMVCTARDPKCVTCPLQMTCQAAPAIARLRTSGGTLPRVKKAGESFRESNRFYRGRIVEALRYGAMPEARLWKVLYAAHPYLELVRFTGAVRALRDEGFLVISRNSIRLAS